MDYLLRDSHHAGVAYGSYDRYRLIDTLRVLPREDLGSSEPALGLEEGGLQSAEALMLARYFMFQQVYFHPVRRIYDIHLKEFLKTWLPRGQFRTEVSKHLSMTDVEVTAAIRQAANNRQSRGYAVASHIVNRTHFKVLYQRNPSDQSRNPEAAAAVYEAAAQKFGAESVCHDSHTQSGDTLDFPVWARDRRIASSRSLSNALNHIPVAAVDYVFIDRQKLPAATVWLRENRENIIQTPRRTEDDEGR